MTDYGKKMDHAVRAVCQMHSDVSRLLQDCDGTIGKGKASIFGSYATHDLTYHVRTRFWMAEAVFRCYDASEESPGLVEGVTVDFLHLKGTTDEPILILGQLKYIVAENNPSAKDICEKWDLWHAFFDLPQEEQSLGVVITPDCDDKDRIQSARIIAVPLYDIAKMADVEQLMEQVRQNGE